MALTKPQPSGVIKRQKKTEVVPKSSQKRHSAPPGSIKFEAKEPSVSLILIAKVKMMFQSIFITLVCI